MSRSMWAILIALSLLLAACGGTPTSQAADEAEPEPAVEASATPEEPTEVPTEEPTATPDAAATQAAEATAQADTVLGEIESVFSELGLSMEGGHLAWLQEEPIDVVLASQNFGGLYDDLGIDTMFGNFVMKVDVTWETETGLAGCGVIFRSEADLNRGYQSQFYTGRLSGSPFWGFELYRYGSWITTTTNGTHGAIDDDNGSTNTYYMVAKNLEVAVYVNGSRGGAISLPAALDEGRLAFLTWSDTGISTCTFENAWVWELP